LTLQIATAPQLPVGAADATASGVNEDDMSV
jgi:hypothetical protein